MNKKIQNYIKLLKKFHSDVTSDESLTEMFEVYWDEVRCDLYFKDSKGRSVSASGHNMPDHYFLIATICPNLDDLPLKYDELANAIDSYSNGKDLETLFICDRCSDGEPGSAQWEN